MLNLVSQSKGVSMSCRKIAVEGLLVKCLFERGVFVYFLLYIALCQVGFTSVVV